MIHNKKVFTEHHTTIKVVMDFIKALINLQFKYKEQYYTIAKVLEALCIAETLIIHEKWKNTEFLDETSRSVLEKTEFDYITSDLRAYLRMDQLL